MENTSVFQLLEQYAILGVNALKDFWEIIGPGGKLHPAAFLEHKGHLVIEGVLLLLIIYMFLQHSFKPKRRSEESLTEKEIDALCKEWEPEALVPEIPADELIPDPPMITSVEGKYAYVDGKKLLNVGSTDFFGLTRCAALKDTARATIEKYGVGSCGPRGFYGSIDVHVQLEEQLARFFGTGAGIIYSYDIAAITSIICAYANRTDILVTDEKSNYAIQGGITASRAKAYFFKHNDMEDLERILDSIIQEDKVSRKPINRRFIIIEGIYTYTGELAPLAEIFKLKEKYKFNLIVDETNSLGVLGATGRGAAEHAGLKPQDAEMLVGSMSTVLASVGGFCVGDFPTIDHQRLSSTAYVYSASLPPFLSTAASAALEYIVTNGAEQRQRLAAVAAELRAGLAEVSGFSVQPAYEGSPIIHVKLQEHLRSSRRESELLLFKVCDYLATDGGVLANVTKFSSLDRLRNLEPTIKINACSEFTDEDVEMVVAAFKAAAKSCL